MTKRIYKELIKNKRKTGAGKTDEKIYKFVEIETGKEISLTRKQMASVLNFSKGNISHLINGKIHSVCGYKLKESVKYKKQYISAPGLGFRDLAKLLERTEYHVGNHATARNLYIKALKKLLTHAIQNLNVDNKTDIEDLLSVILQEQEFYDALAEVLKKAHTNNIEEGAY